jgi:hypothetical protein|tara:strand:- start:702 stop:890 length:189 start_codon:yes stop_codon:yes gene_type:complete
LKGLAKDRIVTKYNDYEKMVKGFLRSEKILKEKYDNYSMRMEFEKETNRSFVIIEFNNGEQK